MLTALGGVETEVVDVAGACVATPLVHEWLSAAGPTGTDEEPLERPLAAGHIATVAADAPASSAAAITKDFTAAGPTCMTWEGPCRTAREERNGASAACHPCGEAIGRAKTGRARSERFTSLSSAIAEVHVSHSLTCAAT